MYTITSTYEKQTISLVDHLTIDQAQALMRVLRKLVMDREYKIVLNYKSKL